eukprot:m.235489 g.235489  ORF g.235489 m.235489 type:complete len:342 (+) comp19339_c0_seq4:391-1416(+)
MAPKIQSGELHASIDIPAWSHVKEEENVKNLIESVWTGSHEIRRILFTFFLVVVAIPLGYTVFVQPDSPDTSSVAFLLLYVVPAAGVLYCLVSCHVAVIPPPPGPCAHGPFRNSTDRTMRLDVRRLILIANPVSGKQTTSKIVRNQVLPRFEAAGVHVQYHLTAHKGHGYELAATLDFSGYDGLVVVGGDGTAHEVINGMMARKDQHRLAVGIIPAGTGNSMMMDFQSVSDMCKDVDTAVDVVLQGLAPHIDLNHVVFGPHPVHQQAYSCNLVGYTVDQCLSAINIDDWNGLLGLDCHTFSATSSAVIVFCVCIVVFDDVSFRHIGCSGWDKGSEQSALVE